VLNLDVKNRCFLFYFGRGIHTLAAKCSLVATSMLNFHIDKTEKNDL